MKYRRIVVALAACCAAASYAGPFDAFKGKLKPGMYEHKIEMDMGQVPGMPPGMGKQSHTSQHCVTQEAIDKGEMSKGPRDRANQDCEVKNMNVSGNTATYTMECTKPTPMKADNRITFTGDGYKMDMKMAMNQGGQMMNMTQHMEARYLGPCK